MAVRKIKNSWWVDFRFNGVRYRKRSPENSRAGAQAYEVLLRQKLARGETLDEPEENKEKEQTFEEFAWKWFDVYVKRKKKYSVVKSYKSILELHLLPYFGKTSINKITNLQVEQYKSRKIEKGLANKTINNQLIVLSKSLRCAREWYDMEKIPKIEWLKVLPPKFDFLSYEESKLLLSHAEGVWYEMILTALRTGLRLGELIGLKWLDINFNNQTLTVSRAIVRNVIGPPKSNRERTIPLTGDVFAIFQQRRKKSGFVFVTRESYPLSTNNCFLNIRRICKRAGLRNIGWHTLRHSFASHLVENNAPIKAVQELMGHTDIKTTMRYTHLGESVLRGAIDLLEPHNNNFGQPAVNQHKIYNLNDSGIKIILPNIKQKQAPKGAVSS